MCYLALFGPAIRKAAICHRWLRSHSGWSHARNLASDASNPLGHEYVLSARCPDGASAEARDVYAFE
jgi:hypothetical protein